MRRILIHLAVALVAFTVGVTAASILGVALGTRTKQACARSVYVAPMPAEHHSCPSMRLKAVPVPPVAPVAPIPPVAPAAPKVFKETHIRIRRPDGTVRVIELQTEESADKQF